jgi:hypothetical protein
MHRFWERWRPFFRELPHGATYLGSAMILAIWLAAGFHLYTFRHQLYESFRQNAANLARAFEQDVQHALHEVDWTIKLLRSQYVRNDPSFDFAGLISELTNADGLTFQYVIIGPDGLMLMSSVTSSTASVNLSDREHFRVHLDSDQDRLFVSKPILGKVTGKWTIQLTRRISNADGLWRSYRGVGGPGPFLAVVRRDRCRTERADRAGRDGWRDPVHQGGRGADRGAIHRIQPVL